MPGAAQRLRSLGEDDLSYSACIDIGGTFTDLVVYEHGNDLSIFKAPSTPGEFERGFIDVLDIAARHYGHDLRSFLGSIDRLVHGTTVSTNALVEGKVARVGLICNEGHPDVLTLREAIDDDGPDQSASWPSLLAFLAATRQKDGP